MPKPRLVTSSTGTSRAATAARLVMSSTGGAEVAFVAAQQDIGAAIDQHHRIDVELFDQVPVRRP